MDSIGRILRVSIIGESHGELVGALVEGCPPGIEISTADFMPDIIRRSPGKKGTTTRMDNNIPLLRSGIFNGKTSGAPILIEFKNEAQKSADYDEQRYFRPGHADLTANIKYHGFNDYRGGGRFSGRLTLPLVAAGVIAKKLLTGITTNAKVIEAGGLEDIEKAVDIAIESGDSIGAIVECVIEGVPPGWGEPYFDSIESLISHLIFSIPGVKAIEFGSGFNSAKIKGSEMNDRFIDTEGRTATNNGGGINGGIANGNDIIFRVAFRPTPSIRLPQSYILADFSAIEQFELKGRHDVCFALRVPPIVEACASIVLADLMLLFNSAK